MDNKGTLEKFHFSWKKLGSVIAFYSLAGISGIFFLPFASILSIALLISGVLAPIAGIIKMVGFLFGFDTPFVMFQIGAYTAAPPFAFLLSILFGAVFIVAGRGLWKFMLRYIRLVSKNNPVNQPEEERE